MTEYISIEEFRDAGYLQEANRRFFHPLGLALEGARTPGPTEQVPFSEGSVTALAWLIDRAVAAGIATDEYVAPLRKALEHAETIHGPSAWLTGVADERSDLEGVYFAQEDPVLDANGTPLTGPAERARKQANIDRLWLERSIPRLKALGYVIQDLGG